MTDPGGGLAAGEAGDARGGARRFQQLAADTLVVKKQARTAAGVPGFTGGQSPAWVGHTLALR